MVRSHGWHMGAACRREASILPCVDLSSWRLASPRVGAPRAQGGNGRVFYNLASEVIRPFHHILFIRRESLSLVCV